MSKEAQYDLLFRQLSSLLEGETDLVAKMANMAAVLHDTFGFWWTGFYRVAGEALILGPFQGPVACMHIPFGKGVCGTAWKRNETVVVPDVEQFPGHIACSSASRSEIVVPVHGQDGAVIAVLDIDSDRLATFDGTDRVWLEKVVGLL
jgi:GAF domain-containing protein